MPDGLIGFSFGVSIMGVIECACFLRKEKSIPMWLKLAVVAGISTYGYSQGWLN